MAKLYPRQRELVKLLIGGMILKEAAFQMGLSHGAAKNYIWKARKLLGCRTTEQMMFLLGKEAKACPSSV
jgi:DNA-binding CsgD family transcriptional regulator